MTAHERTHRSQRRSLPSTLLVRSARKAGVRSNCGHVTSPSAFAN